MRLHGRLTLSVIELCQIETLLNQVVGFVQAMLNLDAFVAQTEVPWSRLIIFHCQIPVFEVFAGLEI